MSKGMRAKIPPASTISRSMLLHTAKFPTARAACAASMHKSEYIPNGVQEAVKVLSANLCALALVKQLTFDFHPGSDRQRQLC